MFWKRLTIWFQTLSLCHCLGDLICRHYQIERSSECGKNNLISSLISKQKCDLPSASAFARQRPLLQPDGTKPDLVTLVSDIKVKFGLSFRGASCRYLSMFLSLDVLSTIKSGNCHRIWIERVDEQKRLCSLLMTQNRQENDHMCQWGANMNPRAGYQMVLSSLPTSS